MGGRDCERKIGVPGANLSAQNSSEKTTGKPADSIELINKGAVIARDGEKTVFPSVVRLPVWLDAADRANPKAIIAFIIRNRSRISFVCFVIHILEYAGELVVILRHATSIRHDFSLVICQLSIVIGKWELGTRQTNSKTD